MNKKVIVGYSNGFFIFSSKQEITYRDTININPSYFPKQSAKKHGKLYYTEMEYNKLDGNTGMVVKVKNG